MAPVRSGPPEGIFQRLSAYFRAVLHVLQKESGEGAGWKSLAGLGLRLGG